MTKETVTLYMDKIRFWVSLATLWWLVTTVAWIASWKTEVDLALRSDKVSPTDFAVLKNDVAYIKDTVKLLLEKKG